MRAASVAAAVSAASAAIAARAAAYEMNARMLGIICALLAAMPNLIGCESSRSQDYQFEKQIERGMSPVSGQSSSAISP
jgi:hypothetical protein